ncbi:MULTISPECIES: hypothetical protein [Actinomadura]|uniref:Uncharacterized protein n=1 Tax=Actinomadura yumaensis TaxID=111807 RepID=A0ABW2CII0_9ACTN|nr:hypothetical protein [Actinomadura sp. J1-007]MWK39878.1 hypothetical protein [Actinomadura sp. J1-007]
MTGTMSRTGTSFAAHRPEILRPSSTRTSQWRWCHLVRRPTFGLEGPGGVDLRVRMIDGTTGVRPAEDGC